MIGSTMVKTKGNAYYQNGTQPIEIWDSIDAVYPPVENSATFLTTNFHRTMGQKRGICDSTDPCKTNADCKGRSTNVDSGGIRTGNCTANGYCQVYAWCPVEASLAPRNTTNYLHGVDQFTIFFRVSVYFPSVNIRASSASALVPGKTLFTASDLLAKAQVTFQEVRQLGVLMAISYDWTCNLDYSISKCEPKMTFSRLDDPTSGLSTGFNYRHASYYSLPINNDNSTEMIEHRNLFKLYGLRFIVLVSGVGGMFDFKNLATNLGSGLAMLSIAAVVADVLLMYILPKRAIYRQVKFKEMEKFIDETDHETSINEGDPLLRRV